jgi:hypothetical protein
MSRGGVRDGLVAAALLGAALLPMRAELARPGVEPLSAPTRVRIAQEAFAAAALAERALPHWNPYEFGGRPHLADPGTRALYVPHVVLRALPLDLFFPVSLALHAWLAGLGAYLAARHLHATRTVAFAAAVAIMLGGVLAPRVEMRYADVYRIAWLPLMLTFVLRSVERLRILPHPGLVIVAALAVTGFPRGILDMAVMVAACGLFAFFWPPNDRLTRPRLAGQFALLVAITAGLTAFQLLPAARSRRGAAETGGLASAASTWVAGHPDAPRSAPLDSALAKALTGLRVRGRVLAACPRIVDSTHLMPLGIPEVGGQGGALSGDYARFINLVRGPGEPARPVYLGIPEAASETARTDLMGFLAVEYLLSCEAPGSRRWTRVSEAGGVGVYRNTKAAPRAFWTCSPEAVGREELEYRLRAGTYDDRFLLRARPVIHVRWVADVDDEDRRGIEALLSMVPRQPLGDQTWQYELLDASTRNLAAIVTHPRIEDTQNIDRRAYVLTPPPSPTFGEPRSEWLIGGEACGEMRPATVLTQDRVDGSMRVAVEAPRDGLVFLSETYDAARLAWLDGRRVETLKVNLAFTGVPVTAGIHRIELAYDRKPFLIGVAVSLVTLVVWAGGEWRARPR